MLLPDDEVLLSGVILDVPEMYKNMLRLTLDRVCIENQKIQGYVQLFLPAIYASSDLKENDLAPGNGVSASAVLRKPYHVRTSGRHLYGRKKNGIVAYGTIKNLNIIKRKTETSVLIPRIRQRIGSIMDASLSRECAVLLKALIPGLKGGIPPEMRDAFTITGLAHVLSISGTHFGLLAMIFFKTGKWLLLRLPSGILTRLTQYLTPTQLSVMFVLPLLFLYGLISGMSIPTMRSLVMISIYLIALLLGRRGQWLNSLSVAATVILLYHPKAVFELSFQLSFMAVFSIGYVLQRQQKKNDDSRPDFTLNPDSRRARLVSAVSTRVRMALLLTVAAMIGTAPIVVLAFKQFSLIAPVSNVIVTPLVCFVVLPLGLILSFIAVCFDASTMPLDWCIEGLTRAALLMIDFFSLIPYANIHAYNPSALLVGGYYVSLYLLMNSGNTKLRLLPIILLLFFYCISPLSSQGSLKITVLNVGQGDASVIEFPDGKVMLIDGGSQDNDAGRRIVAPYFWSKGRKTIDFLVLSHPHPDHYGGLIYVMNNFNIHEVWTNGIQTDESREFFQLVQKKGIKIRKLARGDVVKGVPYSILILHPHEEFAPLSPRGDFSYHNNLSLVMKIQSRGRAILFTGDIEQEAEEDLAAVHPWLQSDVIKIPHHGSRTSSSGIFLDMVRPEIGVISVGQRNPFKHPHGETLDRYRDRSVNILRTDRDGTVQLTLRDGRWREKTSTTSSLQIAFSWQKEMRNITKLLTP